jgi:hypothetical protein
MTWTMSRAGRHRARRAAAALLAGCILSGAAIVVLGGSPAPASAATVGCSQTCVILVEVNGLEPKDVTKATTPFLWALAHSGDATNDPVANNYPALGGRNGWAWQAARSVMSTGDGPATAALLTGDTAEQSGIPADNFAVPSPSPSGQTTLKYYATGGSIPTPDCQAADPCDPAAQIGLGGQTVLSEAQSSGQSVGIWLGDPALCTIVNAGLNPASGLMFDKVPGTGSGTLVDISNPQQGGPQSNCPALWTPTASPGSTCPNGQPCYEGESPYCPPPADWPVVGGNTYYPAACPATDEEVLGQAVQDMTGSSSSYPSLSFLYLAGVGKAKQLAGDSDCFAELGCGTANAAGLAAEPPAVSRALQSTDAALAAFASALAQNAPTAWSHTYLMVVGSHGYEPTPTPLRIPDPNATSSASACSGTQTGLGDLSCYVSEDAGSTGGQPNAVLVPQGTMGTIYYTGPNDPQTEEATLGKLYTDLCGAPQAGQTSCSGGQVNPACQSLLANQSSANPVATPNCIENVYYVDPSVIPAADASKYSLSQFLFGMPGDPGYPTSADPTYDANPHCQSTDASAPFYDAGNCDPNLLRFYEQQQGSWHYNVLSTSTVTPDPSNPQNTTTVYTPTQASGQMVVVFGPGWAAGPLVGAVTSTGGQGPGGAPAAPVGDASDPVDPYLASSGGPRDRAIAAIINGPNSSVVQFPDSAPGGSGDGLAPVTKYDPAKFSPSSTAPGAPYVCSKSFLLSNAEYQDSPSTASLAVDQANASPGNDSAAFGSDVFNSQFDSFVPTGFECQAQIIDFAPTIQALMAIPPSSTLDQGADARFLDEAFDKCLGQNTSDASGPICGAQQTLGTATPPPPPPPPPVVIQLPVIIYKPPPPPTPYKFKGQVRNVEARVVDQRNNTVPYATPGTYLSSIRITADFGKPVSEVTITLYRRAASTPAARAGRRAHTGRVGLTAIVRFCPFTVQRSPNVQLRFVVPTAYQPDYVGLSVRQVRMLSSATGPGCGAAKHNAFTAYGPQQGAIVPILDAALLHRYKPCPSSLTVPLPHGPGVSVRSVTISRGQRVVRVIRGARLSGARVTIPAGLLPGGLLQVRVQWRTADGRRALAQSSLDGFLNCTASQRHWLGVAGG